ncbi:TPA: hypothetical protein HA335_02180 [Methanocaldococcus jannaschii]|uniref:Uncharacterized protein MJ1676 n=2 Tax=Methanocaldococcus jannaschii TaxID=2190 RepID=Y1676_METJA|nr:hypothetical protein [Methanocaldococcus jannaschii]Q59070.1 RecName: Full=Uncharacterized protein MJ1676 [Methanocaldococcus jannaschii DSM 2661]AAB99698.1 conserved hypothetical protein [Methanocaldococcus jannaschii DSM 2661]HII59380.1 hypothetical protein [Methanocaldococcus jannaschii]
MKKYIVSIGVDISDNDVKTNPKVNELVNKEIKKRLSKLGIKATISNITGDDIVITSFVPENLIEKNNKIIFEVLNKYAEGFDDLRGISEDKDKAGEGLSYAIAESISEYGDAIIIAFDTYGGESFVDEMALFVKEIGEKFGYDVGCSVSNEPIEIPGIGYTGAESDDPVVVITVEELDDIPKLAGLIYGGLLSFDKLYFVKNGDEVNILPPGVIYTMTAFLNGNVIDLYGGIRRKIKF